MTLYATIELPEETTLPAHCPDMQTLTRRLAAAIQHAALVSTISPMTARVTVTHHEPPLICGSCAAPLLPSGRCSSRNCAFGRVQQDKGAKHLLATVPGLKPASKLKR